MCEEREGEGRKEEKERLMVFLWQASHPPFTESRRGCGKKTRETGMEGQPSNIGDIFEVSIKEKITTLSLAVPLGAGQAEHPQSFLLPSYYYSFCQRHLFRHHHQHGRAIYFAIVASQPASRDRRDRRWCQIAIESRPRTLKPPILNEGREKKFPDIFPQLMERARKDIFSLRADFFLKESRNLLAIFFLYYVRDFNLLKALIVANIRFS